MAELPCNSYRLILNIGKRIAIRKITVYEKKLRVNENLLNRFKVLLANT